MKLKRMFLIMAILGLVVMCAAPALPPASGQAQAQVPASGQAPAAIAVEDTGISAPVPAEDIPLPPGPMPTEFPTPLSFFFVVLVPFALQYVKRWIVSPKVRWWIAVIGSGVGGILCAVVSGIPFNGRNLVVFLFASYGFSQLAWGIFKYLIMNGNMVDPATGKKG